MCNKSWTIPDLIDLEFFLHEDKDKELSSLAIRDRAIYAECTASAQDSSSWLQCWLNKRRRIFVGEDGENVLPGRIWREAMVLFSWGTLLLGVISGASLAFSFLSYSGQSPVNVAAYVALFVLVQALFFLLFLGISGYRHLAEKPLAGSLLYQLLNRIFFRLIRTIANKTSSRVPAAKQLEWSALAGVYRALQNRYATLFLRPFFLVAQLFGLSFNAGVLVATLLRVVGYDLAFGWQTTLQVSTSAVYHLARMVSIPWRWLIPTGCPSLAQVEGSRLVLKNGIYNLATRDLVSWWPFLSLAVLCYCLLPRLLLFLYGMYKQRRELASLTFNHGRYRQLLHRMKTPVVSTRGIVEKEREPVEEQSEVDSAKFEPGADFVTYSSDTVSVRQDSPPVEASHGEPLSANDKIAVLVPDELMADCSPTLLQKQIFARFGYEVAVLQVFWGMERSEEEEIAALLKKMETHQCGDILILQEAWQPPIQENLSFLKLLRASVGESPSLFLGLIGKPAPDTLLTPVDPVNFKIWQQKLATLADPGLQLVELVT
jgi:hypothetical protein